LEKNDIGASTVDTTQLARLRNYRRGERDGMRHHRVGVARCRIERAVIGAERRASESL
jgi:hypothetical protein